MSTNNSFCLIAYIIHVFIIIFFGLIFNVQYFIITFLLSMTSLFLDNSYRHYMCMCFNVLRASINI